ncbi:hypothetical protein MXB_514 [Myxobolus squamalis]|nr:hypothetical protein MXB_514 [Myxobolus squamalis]
MCRENPPQRFVGPLTIEDEWTIEKGPDEFENILIPGSLVTKNEEIESKYIDPSGTGKPESDYVLTDSQYCDPLAIGIPKSHCAQTENQYCDPSASQSRADIHVKKEIVYEITPNAQKIKDSDSLKIPLFSQYNHLPARKQGQTFGIVDLVHRIVEAKLRIGDEVKVMNIPHGVYYCNVRVVLNNFLQSYKPGVTDKQEKAEEFMYE